jgi:hypothetical protein
MSEMLVGAIGDDFWPSTYGHLEKCRFPVAAPSETHVLARVELSLPPRIWRFFEVPLCFCPCGRNCDNDSVEKIANYARNIDSISDCHSELCGAETKFYLNVITASLPVAPWGSSTEVTFSGKVTR